MTEGLSGMIDNCYSSAVVDLSGNNPSVASGDTSLPIWRTQGRQEYSVSFIRAALTANNTEYRRFLQDDVVIFVAFFNCLQIKGCLVTQIIDIKTPRLIQFNYSSADFAA